MTIRFLRLLRGWMAISLALSLMFNLLLVGGYLYQRHVAIPRAHSVWGPAALHLDKAQQADLLKLQAWARDTIREMLVELRPDIAAARTILREGYADDVQFGAAMRRVSDRRLQMQMQAAAKIFAFRDSLTPEQRQIFSRLAEEPGFALRLLGIAALRQDPDE